MKVIKRENANTPAVNNLLGSLFFDDLFNWNNSNWQSRGYSPAVNISESDEGFNLDLAAPGMKKEDFKIELENDVLTISAEAKTEREETKNNVLRKEFGFTGFKKSFTLPENAVNDQDIKAQYNNGVLSVFLPKREEAKPQPPRMIEIS